EMDPSGLLLEEYCATLQENYDTPEQVLRLYTEALVPGVWNPMFFEDCGVVRPEHQTLFATWLSAARGRPSSPTDELAAAKPPPPALLHEAGSCCCCYCCCCCCCWNCCCCWWCWCYWCCCCCCCWCWCCWCCCCFG
ncbi:unnamed protein product, partial [Polarella glacialis]